MFLFSFGSVYWRQIDEKSVSRNCHKSAGHISTHRCTSFVRLPYTSRSRAAAGAAPIHCRGRGQPATYPVLERTSPWAHNFAFSLLKPADFQSMMWPLSQHL